MTEDENTQQDVEETTGTVGEEASGAEEEEVADSSEEVNEFGQRVCLACEG